MPDSDYRYCNNDLEVKAGDRTSYRTAGWWSTNWASEGMCNWSVCGATDVREWFASADRYITKKFKPHFERYKSHIATVQGAPNTKQQQIIDEANALLNNWANYANYFRRGGGGPVGASFQTGGFVWSDPGSADPEGPGTWDFLSGDKSLELSREIVDYFDDAACLRDKFNDTRPEGMLEEVPGHGKATERPEGAEPAAESTSPMVIAVYAVGAWVLLKALTE